MKYLLDTHIFIWMVAERRRLSKATTLELDDLQNELLYSPIVSWEIGMRVAAGKLHFTGSPLAIARRLGLSEVLLSADHCEAAAHLPLRHKDPFDRLLIAQAVAEKAVVVSGDAAFRAYDVPLLFNR